LGGVGVTVFAVVIVLGYLLTVYPATYIFRWATWGDSNVGDKYRFPSRSMPASSAPYRFRVTSDPESIRSILRAADGGEDVERMLADTGTEALLVLRGDTLLYEGYFNGTRRESRLTSFSVAKSVTSALVGIALAEGKLGSLDDPIARYLPELVARDPRFAQVSLRHLITMASGFQYADKGFLPSSDLTLDYEYPDLRTLCREHIKIDGPPGEHWLYNSYLPILMGMILERVTV
jgi:CubicO group peptidase (beta-lactamase class C family)